MITTRRKAIKTFLYTATAYAAANPLMNSLYAAIKPSEEKVETTGFLKLPPLGYAYDALEPYIDAKTMELHYSKHHQSYVTKLTKALANEPEWGQKSAEDLLRDLNKIPESIRQDVRNQGGGHANHSLLWKVLQPGGSHQPEGKLAKAVDSAFNNFSQFQEKFQAQAEKLFGSGWVWLSLDDKKQLQLESLPNQDSPFSYGRTPLMGIDIWEHAYYLKYQNRRADYIKAFSQVINWSFVSKRYEKLIA